MDIRELVVLMERLRDPVKGCPWDREQNFASIAPYTLEEAYEVADAIEQGDWKALREELGDLLFQVVFHAQMAKEAGHFGFGDVVFAIVEKMIRRHPHVFGGETVAGAEAQTEAWEAQKGRERAERSRGEASLLDGVARALPALVRAEKLQKRAARAGFDWPEVSGVREKVAEELREVEEALARGEPAAVAEEVGDLLFACVNLARHAGVDPEMALREANGKFERRFRRVEAALREQGRSLEQATLAEMDALWDAAKAAEKGGRVAPPQ